MKWANLRGGYKDQLRSLAAADPYDLLGVRRDVSSVGLKKAYLSRVKAYHPDRAHSFLKDHHQEVLKLINAAFERIKKERGYAG
jgi:DnaJ-class molecular chaperone